MRTRQASIFLSAALAACLLAESCLNFSSSVILRPPKARVESRSPKAAQQVRGQVKTTA